MHRFFIICFLLIPFVAFGEIKKITKTEKVVVPHNQSVEQVLDYTSEKLARIAAEEAGVAISSNTTLVDGKISKDEIKMQTSAIAQKETKLLKQETINGVTYITVQVTASVDSAELDAFLRQLMQNEALKKELEQERKAKLALEKKLKKASKEEYDSTLSKEAENIAKVQKARQKQLEIEMANAKQQFMEAERRQKQEELEAMRELERIEKEYKAQDAALQKKIAAEKNAEAKAEMEHQALLAELAQNALINDKKLDTMSSDTIEIIAIDAGSVRVNFAALIKEYKTAMDANEKKLHSLHLSQLEILKKQAYTVEKPVKGEWESSKEYNARLSEYNKNKREYELNNKQKIADAEKSYKEKIEKSKTETTKSLINALTPLYDRLVKYAKGRYTSGKTAKAVISFGERDVDNVQLPITINYDGKTYDFTYKFQDIQEFRAMYETRASFKAIPLFGAEAKGSTQAKPYLTGFNVVHLGNNKEKFFLVQEKTDAFPEIIEYERMMNEINGNNQTNDESSYVTTNKSTSNIYKRRSHIDFFWLYGASIGGGFDLDSLMTDFEVQTHWRFNDWFGIYTNAGILLGFYGFNYVSKGYSDYYYDDDYYDDYYSGGSVTNKLTGIDYLNATVHAGIGLDFYMDELFMMFLEVNGGYVFTDRTGRDSDFGVLVKGGLALHSLGNTDSRLTFFVEHIFSSATQGQSPFFGAGLYF